MFQYIISDGKMGVKYEKKRWVFVIVNQCVTTKCECLQIWLEYIHQFAYAVLTKTMFFLRLTCKKQQATRSQHSCYVTIHYKNGKNIKTLTTL